MEEFMSRRAVRLQSLCVAFALYTIVSASSAAQATYFPPPGNWEKRTAAQVGLSQASVDSAVKLAIAAESKTPRDLLENHLASSFGTEPHSEAVGPFTVRGGASGLIIRRGYLVAEWGDVDHPENTYSVTKSFVSTTIGLAYDRKMIRDLNDPVRLYMPPVAALKGVPSSATALAPVPPNAMGDARAGSTPAKGVAYDAFDLLEPFESEHNRRITWDHLLRQTSDWQGTLWGKPDWADRPQGDVEQWKVRKRNEPGTVYTYNDVRVNATALASLMVWRRPLPQVLREYVMDPIGASNTWRWYGYDNSWIILDGQLVQSVAGGAHWGGGMIINARDMARFGLLTLRKGKWGDRQILSEDWIRKATTPGVNAGYGFMNYFLNTGKRAMPSAPEQSYQHRGSGNNIIYVDPVNDLVVVVRWIDSVRSMDAVIRQLLVGIK
jgi:CubicO group peptidase (beta-lactamase class C family)